MAVTFNSNHISGSATPSSCGGYFLVEGSVNLPHSEEQQVVLKYAAASAPDRLLSVEGSGLPFANREMALSTGENSGIQVLSGGNFKFVINTPNSYYSCQGKQLVPPSVEISAMAVNREGVVGLQKQVMVVLCPAAANRSLTSLPGGIKRSTGR